MLCYLTFSGQVNVNPPMGVLCLSVCFSWLIRGGVAPTTGPISSPSLGSVKWKEISVIEKQKRSQIDFSACFLLKQISSSHTESLMTSHINPPPRRRLCRPNIKDAMSTSTNAAKKSLLNPCKTQHYYIIILVRKRKSSRNPQHTNIQKHMMGHCSRL